MTRCVVLSRGMGYSHYQPPALILPEVSDFVETALTNEGISLLGVRWLSLVNTDTGIKWVLVNYGFTLSQPVISTICRKSTCYSANEIHWADWEANTSTKKKLYENGAFQIYAHKCPHLEGEYEAVEDCFMCKLGVHDCFKSFSHAATEEYLKGFKAPSKLPRIQRKRAAKARATEWLHKTLSKPTRPTRRRQDSIKKTIERLLCPPSSPYYSPTSPSYEPEEPRRTHYRFLIDTQIGTTDNYALPKLTPPANLLAHAVTHILFTRDPERRGEILDMYDVYDGDKVDCESKIAVEQFLTHRPAVMKRIIRWEAFVSKALHTSLMAVDEHDTIFYPIEGRIQKPCILKYFVVKAY